MDDSSPAPSPTPAASPAPAANAAPAASAASAPSASPAAAPDPTPVAANRRRRSVLGLLAGAAAVWPLLSRSAAAQPPAIAQPPAADPPAMPTAPIGDLGPAILRPGRSRKASSYDRSGGNADFFVIPAGGEKVLLDSDGPGVVRHIWFTVNGGPHHLKDIVLTIHWDHEATPSVEVPLGDFFGLGLGHYFTYAALPMTVAPERALNCYLPMPFRRHARIAVRNQGGPIPNFYSNIDFELTAALPADAAYFHAQYRQAAPCHGWTNDWSGNGGAIARDPHNRFGRDNYVFLDARGRGQYIGTSLAVLQNQNGWWGEGDDMIFIDEAGAARGSVLPTINGTGSEDYFNGAWDFGDRSFSYPYNGAPLVVDPEKIGGRWCVYRWHLPAPIRFQRSLRVTIEHGSANSRSDNFYSVAYWYQTEPHAPFPPLPPPQARHPQVFAVGGPSGARRP